MAGQEQSSSILFESIAYRLGFKQLEAALSRNVSPLVLFAVGLVVVDLVFLQWLKHVEGYTVTFLRNPVWLIQPAFALLAAGAVVFLESRYQEVLQEIDIENRTTAPKRFQSLRPHRVTASLYIGVVLYRAWRVFVDMGVREIIQIGGISELVGLSLITFGYHIIYVEFLATYLAIVVLLPRTIRHSDFKLDFLDPEGLGGLRPVGELAKTAYYFIVIGLLGYLLIIYAPHILKEYIQASYPEPGIIINVGFTAVWLLTIGTMAYGFAQLHWFMKREKRTELTRLHDRSRELVENRFSVEDFEIRDETAFDDLRRRMEYVDKTHEYPTTFTMWSQILISLVLPKAAQIVLEGI